MAALWKPFLVGSRSQKGAEGRAGTQTCLGQTGQEKSPSSQLRTEKVRAALGRGLLGGEGRFAPGNKGIPHSEAAWPHNPTRGHSILPAHPPSLCSDATLRRDLSWPSHQKPLLPLFSVTEPSYVFLHDNLKLFICLPTCLCIYSLSPLLN